MRIETDPPQDPENNEAIRSARAQIRNLESQLSQQKVDHNMTTAEKEALASEKARLESEKAQLEAQVAEKETLKARATELETRFASLVADELASIPEDKREDAKNIIDGLTPDQQLDKLKSLRAFMGVNANPPPGNPPPPPRNPTPSLNPNDPPQTNPEDKLKEFKEMVSKGQDPLSQFPLKAVDLTNLNAG